MKFILFITTLVIFLSSCNTKTIVKNIPIETKDPYVAHVWSYNPETGDWGWYDAMEVNEIGSIEWYIEKEFSCIVDPFDELHVLFIRGFSDCADTTTVTVYGGYLPEKIKDKKNRRVILKLDGKKHTFGTEAKKPKL